MRKHKDVGTSSDFASSCLLGCGVVALVAAILAAFVCVLVWAVELLTGI